MAQCFFVCMTARLDPADTEWVMTINFVKKWVRSFKMLWEGGWAAKVVDCKFIGVFDLRGFESSFFQFF